MSSGVKAAIWVVAIALVLLVVIAIFASSPLSTGSPWGTGPMMGPGGMMNGGSWWGPGGMMGNGWGLFGLLWTLVPLLFWGGLIALIAWAVVHLASTRHHDDAGIHRESAEETLRQRFARGEIDAEEYEERRRVLNESRRGEVPK
jgi:putative membrane protein